MKWVTTAWTDGNRIIFESLNFCVESNSLLQDSAEVVLWMNTVGPYHNRQETYGYFTLPFCHGPKTDIGMDLF